VDLELKEKRCLPMFEGWSPKLPACSGVMVLTHSFGDNLLFNAFQGRTISPFTFWFKRVSVTHISVELAKRRPGVR